VREHVLGGHRPAADAPVPASDLVDHHGRQVPHRLALDRDHRVGDPLDHLLFLLGAKTSSITFTFTYGISQPPRRNRTIGPAAAVEVASRRGPVHDVIAENHSEWLSLLDRLVREGQETGELSDAIDPSQLAFELHALVVGANNAWILSGNEAVLDQARRGVRERIERATPAAPA
jgi:hypothetical protein